MDPAHIARLKEEQELAYHDTNAKISQWQKFNDDYSAVQDRLQTLPEKVTHEVMVPFGPLAFMPGQIIHTNEIMVLLGDNWFAERSSKQACEIIDRRKKQIDETLGQLEEQKRLLGDRLGFTSEFKEISENKEGIVDIQEEYDPEKERQWREERKRKKQEGRKAHQQKTSAETYKSSKPDQSTVSKATFPESRTKHKDDDHDRSKIGAKEIHKKPKDIVDTRKPGQRSNKVSAGENTGREDVEKKRANMTEEEKLWARLDELERREDEMDELARLSDYEEDEEEEDQPMFSFAQEEAPKEPPPQKSPQSSRQLQRSNSAEKKVQWKDQQESGSSSSSVDEEDVMTSTIHFTHTKTDEKQETKPSHIAELTSPADIYKQYKAMQPFPDKTKQSTSARSSARATAAATQSADHPLKSIMKPVRPVPDEPEPVMENPPKQILPQIDSVFSGSIVERPNVAMPTQSDSQPVEDKPPKRVSKFKAARQQKR